jgi:hypothetical protein
MLWPSPSRLTSELPGQSGLSSARSFGQLGARNGPERAVQSDRGAYRRDSVERSSWFNRARTRSMLRRKV